MKFAIYFYSLQKRFAVDEVISEDIFSYVLNDTHNNLRWHLQKNEINTSSISQFRIEEFESLEAIRDFYPEFFL